MSNQTISVNLTPVTQLKGVGSVLAGKLAKLNIVSIQDLLLHLPYRYIDKTCLTPIANLYPKQLFLIEGSIIRCDIVQGKRPSLVCCLQDDTGRLNLRFFHFYAQQKTRLQPGMRLRCFGEVRIGRTGFEIYHPEYQLLGTRHVPLSNTLTPVYPATEGITQKHLQALVLKALRWFDLQQAGMQEVLPHSLLSQLQLPLLKDAIRYLHQPPVDSNLQQLNAMVHPCQQRLIYEELLAHHCSLLRLKQHNQKISAPAFTSPVIGPTVIPFTVTVVGSLSGSIHTAIK